MHRCLVHWLLGLLFGCLLSGLSGCAGSRSASGWTFWPFGNKSDTVPGLMSPPERLAAIRTAVKEASAQGADAQERVARELAAALAEEKDPLIRLEIVHGVGGFQTPTTAWILRAALKDTDLDVRVAACKAWGKHRNAEAASLLSEVALSDVEADVRLAAVRGLGEVGDRSGVAALGKTLDNRDPTMQYYAVESLRKISGQDYGNDLSKWRQYAKGETPAVDQPSIAGRIRSIF